MDRESRTVSGQRVRRRYPPLGRAERMNALRGRVPDAVYTWPMWTFVLTSREGHLPPCVPRGRRAGKTYCLLRGCWRHVRVRCGRLRSRPFNLDILAMPEHVICLLDSPEFRLRMGEAARRKVAERHVISVADRVSQTLSTGRSRRRELTRDDHAHRQRNRSQL